MDRCCYSVISITIHVPSNRSTITKVNWKANRLKSDMIIISDQYYAIHSLLCFSFTFSTQWRKLTCKLQTIVDLNI